MMKKNCMIPGLVVTIVLITLPILQSCTSTTSDDALYIAVAGPMSGQYQEDGEDTVRGIELYLDQINQAGGINGKDVKLLVFDDQNDTYLARERALEIVAQNQALAVIGHAFSTCSIAAGEIYQENGIPAISGSAAAEAVTEGNDWYFRVILSSRSQGAFLANYTWHVLRHKSAGIIYDQDDSGTALMEAFESTFTRQGGEIKYQGGIDRASETLDTDLDEIVDALVQNRANAPDIIFLTTKPDESVKLIATMRRKGLNYPVIGPTTLANIQFIANFDEYYEERANPGYFSDGVYAASAFILDIAGAEAQHFEHEFIKKYPGAAPGMKAATNYDAVKVVIEAMKLAGVQGDPNNLEEERRKIRDQLAAFNNVRDAIQGITGYIYFDPHGNVVKPIPIGVYENQHLVSAPIQLRVVNPRYLADLDQESILSIGEKYMQMIKVIQTGIHINQIGDIDVQNFSYTMDFYLWFQYDGELDDYNIEFTNAVADLKLGIPIAEEVRDGVTYRAYHVRSDFESEFKFYGYPFDRQTLNVHFRHNRLTSDNLIYVVDYQNMRGGNSETIRADLRTRSKYFLSGWEIADAQFFQDAFRTGTQPVTEYPGFNAQVTIKRNTLKYVIENLVPVFTVAVASYLVFFMAAEALRYKIIIEIFTLLTTVFFGRGIFEEMSQLTHMTPVEYVFYAIGALALYGIVVSLLSYRCAGKAWVRRLNLISRVIYPLVILTPGVVIIIIDLI